MSDPWYDDAEELLRTLAASIHIIGEIKSTDEVRSIALRGADQIQNQAERIEALEAAIREHQKQAWEDFGRDGGMDFDHTLWAEVKHAK